MYADWETYTLCYENGKEAILMPTEDEAFSLKRYKKELGGDYERIVLYLCGIEDFEMSDGGPSKKTELEIQSVPSCSNHNMER